MAADSRTNAGVDYISAYRKLFDFSLPGERALVICTSGNLSMTQGVINELRRDIHNHEEANLHNPYLARIRQLWEDFVRQAFEAMPNIEWQYDAQESRENILID